ncbi:MAG: tetratricopeptide repeat protein [Bacteroidales bacterium]|nr:tetratricopeptide repeat protein [Bacteroidales bacterium]MDT8372983.1 tetratricopeptide repeat protein [Bacteroidales bacterium]
MKKITLLLLAVIISFAATAQKGKVNAAENFIRDGAFDKAKEAIEIAIAHPKTVGYAKTYYVKGLLAQATFDSGDPKYMEMYPDPLMEAYKNYEKAIELDPKMKNKIIQDNTYARLGNSFLNDAINKFNEKDFKGAMQSFERNVMVSESEMYVGLVDTLVIFNAGLAAYNAEMYEEAIDHFRTCTVTGIEDTKPYIFISDSYMKLQDTVKAEEALMEGYNAYPDTLDIILQATQFYLDADNSEKAFEFVHKAMEMDPQNHILDLVEGSLYMKLEDYEKAIESLKKSLSKKPDQFESNYNIGLSYVSIANEMLNEANMIADNREYEIAKDKAFEVMKEAIPFFLEAEKANPTSVATLEFLREIFLKVKMMDEFEEYKAKVEKLQE